MKGEAAVVEAFIFEIGIPPSSAAASAATMPGVVAALEGELLLPLRALTEGRQQMHKTYRGELIPPAAVSATMEALMTAVLSSPGGYSAWRYGNAVCKEQLRGLTEQQLALWCEPTTVDHGSGLRTHEDAPGELGFFWATKIGGPSHGFDFEAQCLLPLLANARNKVVMLTDPKWPAYPCGRAHWRLLWKEPTSEGSSEPRLWLEAINCDFPAAQAVDQGPWLQAFLTHAVSKADAMQVALSCDSRFANDLMQAAESRATDGCVWLTHERLVLRPSNGVCEASDFLSLRHDWVQLQEEHTESLWRALYVPAPVGQSPQDGASAQ